MNSALQTALAHHQEGRLSEAEQAYRALLADKDDRGEILRLLGGLYLQTGQWQAACEVLGEAAQLAPDHYEILTHWGLALRQAGRADEALQAYGQAARHHPHLAEAHYHFGLALAAAGHIDAAIGSYEKALAVDPSHLDAVNEIGLLLAQTGRADQARPWLDKAQAGLEGRLAAQAGDAALMNRLGTLLQQKKEPERAALYYRDALQAEPGFAQAAANLATCFYAMRRLGEAVDMCRYALQLMPQSADMHVNLGVYLQEMGRHQEAIAAFDQALALQPASAHAKWNKSFSALALGRYEEGLALYEAGIGIAWLRGAHPAPERRWQGEEMHGKKLLLWCEQGFGDALQFIRYAHMCKARGAQVLVQCPAVLRRLLARTPGIDGFIEHVGGEDYDRHAPLMSLPYIFKTRLETIPAPVPYLFIADETRAKWAAKFVDAQGLKVGLVWAGNPREQQLNAHMTDKRRSMHLRQLLPLFDVPGVQFYSLQMGAKTAQIAALGLSNRITDFMGEVEDFEDTAGLIENLDLVISVDTSVVHLAGGLNKPVWVLSRFDACWRWLQNREDSPWYPSARIFGQTAPADWTGPMVSLRAALAEKAAQKG